MEVARRYFCLAWHAGPRSRLCAEPRRPRLPLAARRPPFREETPFEGPRCRFWGAGSAHHTQTILRFSGKFLTFIFSPTVTPGPAAISGPCPGPLQDEFFYTTFPAPDMARKRTLGKLTIEPVDVGGPKLAKPWVHCPMGIVPLAGVVRALWASGRDILGRCGTSVRGRFGPVSETIRGPQAPCCAG